MPSISIELVPRSTEELIEQIKVVHDLFPTINTLNIPDLLRFPLRSWDASKFGLPFFKNVIPHLRAVDFNLREKFVLADLFQEIGLKNVLIITGDKPQDMAHKVYRNTSLELIRVIKKELPHIKVYAGIDPYRTSLSKELDYVNHKIEAGVDGFFTQPFFDMRLLDIYMENLEMTTVFWGICPVTSDKSKSYWESKNEAMFPKNFKLDYDNNVFLAKRIIKHVNDHNSNAYFMPIKTDPVQFLKDVFL